MADSENGKVGNSGAVNLTGKIMVMAIIILIFIVLFIFCLHLYTKCYIHRRQRNTSTATNHRRRRRRIHFTAGHQESAALRRGLDSLVLKTIPITLFDPKELKDGLECAVCLCEVNDGEKIRFLPKCSHGFHVECVDMWFQSHSTCPICRSSVAKQSQSTKNCATDSALETIIQIQELEHPGARGLTPETPNLPSNVLFWGAETRTCNFTPCVREDHQWCGDGVQLSSSSSLTSTSSVSDRTLVIDIPRTVNGEEEQKSPVPTTFRSLKRLLSGSKISPSSLGLEQEPQD